MKGSCCGAPLPPAGHARGHAQYDPEVQRCLPSVELAHYRVQYSVLLRAVHVHTWYIYVQIVYPVKSDDFLTFSGQHVAPLGESPRSLSLAGKKVMRETLPSVVLWGVLLLVSRKQTGIEWIVAQGMWESFFFFLNFGRRLRRCEYLLTVYCLMRKYRRLSMMLVILLAVIRTVYTVITLLSGKDHPCDKPL